MGKSQGEFSCNASFSRRARQVHAFVVEFLPFQA